jgi:hypothetical protein
MVDTNVHAEISPAANGTLTETADWCEPGEVPA